jgi:hypothetical protein
MSAKETPFGTVELLKQEPPLGAWYRACVEAAKAGKPMPPRPEPQK